MVTATTGSLLLALAGLFSVSEAALYGVKNALLRNDVLNDPEVYWPYLLSNDTRFNGIGLVNYIDTVTCAVTLIKSWRGYMPDGFARAQKAYALTSGSCYNTFENVTERERYVFNVPPTPELTQVNFNRTFNNARAGKANFWFNATIERIEFSSVNLTDVSIVRLNRTINDFIKNGFRFYRVTGKIPKKNAPLSAVQFYDPILGFALRRSPGKFLNNLDVFTQGLKRYHESLRFTLNWGTVGSPVFTKHYRIVSMVNFKDTEFNAGPRLDEFNRCFSHRTGLFDFANEACMRKLKVRVLKETGVRLPGTSGYSSKFRDIKYLEQHDDDDEYANEKGSDTD